MQVHNNTNVITCQYKITKKLYFFLLTCNYCDRYNNYRQKKCIKEVIIYG
nr:MAG TPA: hypothetical protein [Caudoviricetes sp.]